MQHETQAAQSPLITDRTDWLKTFAIIFVSIDHFGYFFIDYADWWNTYGRMAAPPFFFLLGYAQTRFVPPYWIGIGVLLTLLDSWNNDWTWVSPNILLSFVLIRLARPYVQLLLQRHGWVAFAFIVAALVAALPVAANIADYGTEGWLWALFGLCQRWYVDDKSATVKNGLVQDPVNSRFAMTENLGLLRLLACIAAATVYVWQEQIEFTFSQLQLLTIVLGISAMAIYLILFRRGASRIQPPRAISGLLRFIGRHTLEIYAVQLAAFEIIILSFPDLGA
ncbi:TraX family protein [Pseudomonadota bacterium]